VNMMIAGFFGRFVGWYAEIEPAGFIASVLGAIVLQGLYRMIAGEDAGTQIRLEKPLEGTR
jgi:hypothetical protein